MNAVEIEEAISELAAQPFDREAFPYAFLAAFGNKETTIKRLRTGQTNASDVPEGVLQRNNIHLAVCDEGSIAVTLTALRASPKTISSKAKFLLVTDGIMLEAEEIGSGETIACNYSDFAKHFGFFLPLAGISNVTEIKNNPFDIKATGRLNKLYVELLKDNPDWATEKKRPALNQFIARLIFCFFAEDTGIFLAKQFSKTVERMSDSQSGNTHEILAELFRAMDTKPEDADTAELKNWAKVFPYVNGGMFAGATDCPRFSRIARSYLLAIGNLEWDKINPDIFGSMIQAVADDNERGELGMHYTSVPNILKVLNPLFLDGLRDQLASAGDNLRKLRNLRRKLANVRVFDPACGSGNFLVIAYKQLREIEHGIILRTKDEPKSWMKLENFYGIEIKNFAVEIARLALLIAEFQCDVSFINQQEARAMVLPLHRTGQIRTGNALQFDWLEVCPPEKRKVAVEHDLAGPTGRLALEGDQEDGTEPETFICGNPPYKGSKWQDEEQKADLQVAWAQHPHLAKVTDYVTGWLAQAERYMLRVEPCRAAFVMTNSVVQGQQAGDLWTALFESGLGIKFAHQSFKWRNLAANNAGVTVVVVGISKQPVGKCLLFDEERVRLVDSIGCFLVPNQTATVLAQNAPISKLQSMVFGNMPRDGGHLILDAREAAMLREEAPDFVRRYIGSQELIDGVPRYCLWIEDARAAEASSNAFIKGRLEEVRLERLKSKAPSTRQFATQPHRFVQRAGAAARHTIAVPGVSSENRDYLPCDVLGADCIISNKNFGLFDAPLWNMALIASRLHWVWIGTVCVRLEMRYSYSNTLGWNTFPVPPLTDSNKSELTRCAENILLAREAHFPASIADMYEPDDMPDDLRRAHEANDEAIEQIYIGRRFRNDTERLEKLFELYTRMTAAMPQPKKKAKRAA